MLITDHSKIKKILIIQWSAMGDTAIATSIFDDIRNHFQNAKIHLNTLPPWQHLFENDHRLDKIIAYPIRKQGIKPNIRWLKEFQQEKYDLVIDIQSNDRTRILLSIAKLFGMKKGTFISRRPFFCYDATTPKAEPPKHIFTQLKEMLATINITVTTQSPKLITSQANVDHVHKILTPTMLHNFALFIPGCSANAHKKRWPEEHYIAFAKLLLEEKIDHIVIIGTKDEADICHKIATTDSRIINLCDQTQLLDLPILCDEARFIIGNDTGASHIAASSKTPQITLFGPTIPEQSKPFGYNVMIVSALEFPKPAPHLHPMININPNSVFKRYLEIIR